MTDPAEPRDDLAALRARIQTRVDAAMVVADDANEALAELREELAELPVSSGRLYASGDLSRRELMVLRLMAQGYGTDRIADELVLSKSTVRNHIGNITSKLVVHSRLDAVVTARRDGLI